LTIEEFVAVWYAVKYSYWNEPKSRKYRNINGVIDTDDMITLSTSLNKYKRNEFKNFNYPNKHADCFNN
jgi:hypothetical protein